MLLIWNNAKSVWITFDVDYVWMSFTSVVKCFVFGLKIYVWNGPRNTILKWISVFMFIVRIDQLIPPSFFLPFVYHLERKNTKFTVFCHWLICVASHASIYNLMFNWKEKKIDHFIESSSIWGLIWINSRRKALYVHLFAKNTHLKKKH